jgi:uncharacterized protein (DUF302 family)
VSEIVVETSRYPFEATMARLIDAVAKTGNTLFADIDQTAAAQGAGLTLRPTRLLILGNPKGGTPLMDAFPLSALDLPLKLLVWQDGEDVRIAYTYPAVFATRYGITGKDAQIAGMTHALETITASAR